MANKHNDARWQIALPDIPARVNPSRPLALLVDDNPDVLVGIGAYLEAAGFEIVRVPNGDEAVAHLASGSDVRSVGDGLCNAGVKWGRSGQMRAGSAPHAEGSDNHRIPKRRWPLRQTGVCCAAGKAVSAG